MATDLTGMDTAAYADSVQYQNRAYLFNGRNAMRKFDGLDWDLAGIARAIFKPTVATQGTGLTGDYIYWVVPINSMHSNRFGRPTAGIPSLPSAQITLANQGCRISGIPSTHPDSQVDFWEIYRSRAGDLTGDAQNGSLPFYYIGRVAIGTTQYDDAGEAVVPDEALDALDRMRFDQLRPPCFKYAEIFGERMFGICFDPFTSGTATKAQKTISNKAIVSGVATITTSAAHGYSAGDWVCVSCSDAAFDGARQIRTVTSDTFTFHVEHADVASAAASGNTEVITLSVDCADGMAGAFFRKDDDNQQYRVVHRNSATQIVLDRLFSGTLSGSNFSIYRYEYDVLFSEHGDMEAWGTGPFEPGNIRSVPGQDPLRGLKTYDGRLFLFSLTNIYAIEGQGADAEDVRIKPDALYQGVGAVSNRSIVISNDALMWVSLHGVMRMTRGGVPQRVSDNILRDWITDLTADEQKLICAGTDHRFVWIAFPVSGGTECSRIWRYDNTTGEDTWWEEDGMYPSAFFNDDNGICYAVCGTEVFRLNIGTSDGGTEYTGTSTGNSTTTLTDSGASFPTSGSGLKELCIRIYSAADGALVGVRRITTNTGTVITWSSSGAGGGTLVHATGCRYEIGVIPWHWRTKTLETPAHMERVLAAHVTFGSKQGSTVTLLRTDYVDGTAIGNALKSLKATRLAEKWIVNQRGRDYSVKLESRNGATVRQVILDVATKDGMK